MFQKHLTHSLKAVSYRVFSMCFDYSLLHEVQCGIFHLRHYVNTQKLSGLRASQSLDFGIRDAQPTTGISHSLLPKAVDPYWCSWRFGKYQWVLGIGSSGSQEPGKQAELSVTRLGSSGAVVMGTAGRMARDRQDDWGRRDFVFLSVQ